MRREWCIDTSDAGLSEEELAGYWSGGDDPAAFVAWFAAKYDLIRFDGRDGRVA